MTVVRNENQTHENTNKYGESVPCCGSHAVPSISSTETVCLCMKTQQSNRGGGEKSILLKLGERSIE